MVKTMVSCSFSLKPIQWLDVILKSWYFYHEELGFHQNLSRESRTMPCLEPHPIGGQAGMIPPYLTMFWSESRLQYLKIQRFIMMFPYENPDILLFICLKRCILGVNPCKSLFSSQTQIHYYSLVWKLEHAKSPMFTTYWLVSLTKKHRDISTSTRNISINPCTTQVKRRKNYILIIYNICRMYIYIYIYMSAKYTPKN